jgi:hypothetical protein
MKKIKEKRVRGCTTSLNVSGVNVASDTSAGVDSADTLPTTAASHPGNGKKTKIIKGKVGKRVSVYVFERERTHQ